MTDALQARRRFKAAYIAAFEDGARCGFTQHYAGERERGGYPKGFHQWPLERRNAWYSGFNLGRNKRLSEVAKDPWQQAADQAGGAP